MGLVQFKTDKRAPKRDKVLSLTNDNRTEFRKLHLSSYYFDPMKPNQRGSLRGLVKKTTYLEGMTQKRDKELYKQHNS